MINNDCTHPHVRKDRTNEFTLDSHTSQLADNRKFFRNFYCTVHVYRRDWISSGCISCVPSFCAVHMRIGSILHTAYITLYYKIIYKKIKL